MMIWSSVDTTAWIRRQLSARRLAFASTRWPTLYAPIGSGDRHGRREAPQGTLNPLELMGELGERPVHAAFAVEFELVLLSQLDSLVDVAARFELAFDN
jgi:hypothetical protein